MADVNLKLLSKELNISVKKIIDTFYKLGILKNVCDVITPQEKTVLLRFLCEKKDIFQESLTLQRKIRSFLNVSSIGGKNKLVKIEIRKNHTYFKNNVGKDRSLNDKTNLNYIEKEKEFLVIKSKKKSLIHINQKSKKELINKKNHEEINNTGGNKLNDKLISSKRNKKNNRDYKVKNIKKNTDRRNISIEEKKIFKDILNNKIDKEEIKKDYHLTTFLRARQAEDENDRAIEGNRRIRNKKIRNNRYRKNNKNLEFKKDREGIKSVMHVGKNSKLKSKGSILQQFFKKPLQNINRDIIIGDELTVSELANKMAVKSSEVIKKMMQLGLMMTINQIVDQETAQLVAEEMGHKVTLYRDNALEELLMQNRKINSNAIKLRPPVVTIMGHVDHGKTSLLDYIRSTNIISKEAGGITQHIGAYCVKTKNGIITFLDTPGHAAFTSMRARGAQITDIVVLVVAADDGVMPQSIESIQHANAAKVPIIVAINKIDKVEGSLDPLKKELIKHSIIPEEWGGENIFIPVSAKSGYGISNLLDAILLQSEILDLKSFFSGMASGVVIESFLDRGRGPVATVLVREGILKKGDILLCGCSYGKVRAMKSEINNSITEAGPSIPVQILGLSKIPDIGDIFTVVNDEKKAREVAFYRQGKFREVKLAKKKKIKLENVFDHIKSGENSALNIVLKSDVQGSLEAISESLIKLSNDEVKINIVGSGVGGITETDVSLAIASNAIILGFNVRADSSAKRMIILENIDIRYYSIIYKLIDEVKTAMSGMLSPEYKQEIIGLAVVRNIFKSPKFSSIAGCMVTEGIIKRNHPVRILRNNIVIYEGELESLRRFKEDVNEIRNAMECGIGIKNYNDIRIGDIIEVFEVKECQRSI
ncbi:translation initiation factor IF-2 [Buchnera aphidicola (Pemphigus obesinymphae)]|uniref:translation initiation factor IF-2 n=1 Tax=Buchnera aphidicola TaxID=9 RepID=UPI002238375F|nr:translation initiation factor IF-2 [Buchnera aphidicola]MCW5196681.1 translation initiation factor IF-2 [Buchnera aphidicola (Pemphigus obesinymphae)]